jgi:hypothetical protein
MPFSKNLWHDNLLGCHSQKFYGIITQNQIIFLGKTATGFVLIAFFNSGYENKLVAMRKRKNSQNKIINIDTGTPKGRISCMWGKNSFLGGYGPLAQVLR